MDSENHSGNGKVARLPHPEREYLNLMLYDGVPYKTIIERLGDHGKDLNEDNIGNWKKHGGHSAWIDDYNARQALKLSHEQAIELNKDKPAAPIQDATRALASGQVFELLRRFNPTTFAAALSEKPELYFRLLGAVSRLSEADSLCTHRRVQQALAELKLDQPEAFSPDKMYTGEQLQEILRHIKIL